ASQKNGAVSKMLVVKDGYSPHEFYVRGGIQGPASDLYALAATMYHLISGKAPPVSQTRVSDLADNKADPYVPLTGNYPQYEPAFLEAIDKAMSIPPKDRIQSAEEWLGLITQETKKPKQVAFAENKNLTKTISELIEETNKHVTPAIRKEQPTAAPKTAPSPRVERFRPDWLEEFNRETVEVAERKRREAERAAAQEAARRAEEARQAKRARLAKEAALEAARQQKRQEEARASSRILGWVTGAKPG
ncbi:MAG: serine/threonine protein kinase, partial [Pseudomonadota bacterium]